MSSPSTHISVILDRTGSMQSIREDTIGGFNAFLHEQQQQPGHATLTLVQFDSQDPYEVIHHFRPIAAIPDLTSTTFVPRASTPLLDAIGRGINDLEKTVADLPAPDKPGRIVMVIITDGQENSSREFTRALVQQMIGEKQQAGWQFVFLSADLTAINEALDSGVSAVSALSFDKTAEGSRKVWASASARIADYRSARSANVSFLDTDREQQDSEKKRKPQP